MLTSQTCKCMHAFIAFQLWLFFIYSQQHLLYVHHCRLQRHMGLRSPWWVTTTQRWTARWPVQVFTLAFTSPLRWVSQPLLPMDAHLWLDSLSLFSLVTNIFLKVCRSLLPCSSFLSFSVTHTYTSYSSNHLEWPLVSLFHNSEANFTCITY